MNYIINLVKLANTLERSGLDKEASIVDNISTSLIKTAQYTGAQGYWVRNSRCFKNCYRKKRASSPDKPAQEIWFECQEEFQKDLNNQDADWNKYAENLNKKIKTASNSQEIDSLLTEEFDINFDEEFLKGANSLIDLSNILAEKDIQLAKVASGIGLDLIKEAGFWSNVGDAAKGLWRGMTNNWNEQDIVNHLKKWVLLPAQNLLTMFAEDGAPLPRFEKQFVTNFSMLRKNLSSELEELFAVSRKNPEAGKTLQKVMLTIDNFVKKDFSQGTWQDVENDLKEIVSNIQSISTTAPQTPTNNVQQNNSNSNNTQQNNSNSQTNSNANNFDLKGLMSSLGQNANHPDVQQAIATLASALGIPNPLAQSSSQQVTLKGGNPTSQNQTNWSQQKAVASKNIKGLNKISENNTQNKPMKALFRLI